MTKEETIIKAIGLLPEEMIVQKETEELKKGAARLEKEEKQLIAMQKCRHALTCAACLALVIIIVYMYKNQDNTKPDMPVKNITETPGKSTENQYAGTSNSKSIKNKKKDKSKIQDAKFFVMERSNKSTENKLDSFSEDNSDTDVTGNINLKETLPLVLVKLQTIKEQEVKEQEVKEQTKSTTKKTVNPEYIVFSLDRDFYFTVPDYKKGGKTYITDKENRKKRFVTGKKELCKAEDKVYFDISVADSRKSCTGIPAWDKKNIQIITSIEIYVKKGKNYKKTGIFYIGSKSKNNKEEERYYGIFKNSNTD